MEASGEEVSEEELLGLLEQLGDRMAADGYEPTPLGSVLTLAEEHERLRSLLGGEPATGLAAWSCFARSRTTRFADPILLPMVPGEGDRHEEIQPYREQPPLHRSEPELVMMDVTGLADFLHVGRDLGGALFVVSPARFVDGAPARLLSWNHGETYFWQADPVAGSERPSTGRFDLPLFGDYIRELAEAHENGQIVHSAAQGGYDVPDGGIGASYRQYYPWPLPPTG